MSQIIVCGLGQVGFRIVSLLLRLGESVTVVTMGSREEFEEIILDMGARIISGDARADKHLRDAGISSADTVIACVDNDLTNIEIALDATRLNPKCKVVVRLFDQNLGARLEESLGIHRALAMSAISAPAFASAALGERIRGSFFWRGETFVILSTPTNEPETALLIKDGAIEIEREEDCARLLCTQKSFLETCNVNVRPRQKVSHLLNLKRGIHILGLFWQTTPKVLKGVAALILALSIVSVFVFQIGMKLSPVDALYFVITTLTTTGYGDISPKDSATWLKLYGCFLMLLGSASVATLYSIITDFIVTVRFDQVLGRHRAASSEHVIVVGLGNVGYRTIVAIKELGGSVVAVDLNPNTEFRGLLDHKTPFVAGDARDTDTLELAGITQATAVIAATDDDAVNLSIGLTAKSMKQDVRTVLRLFDGDLASKIQSSLKVDAALSASRLAAPGFVGAALFEDALFCYVADNKFIALRKPELGEPIVVSSRTLAPGGADY